MVVALHATTPKHFIRVTGSITYVHTHTHTHITRIAHPSELQSPKHFVRVTGSITYVHHRHTSYTLHTPICHMTHMHRTYDTYGVALVSQIDKIIGLFCKRDL